MKGIGYGSKGYKTITTLQRIGDCFRNPFGRYEFEVEGEKVRVVKKRGFSKLDYALTEKDFYSKRFFRELERFFKGIEKKSRKDPATKPPKTLCFYVGNPYQCLYDPESSIKAANDIFRRRNYIKPGTTIKEEKKFLRFVEKLGKYGTRGFLIGGLVLKFLGRQGGGEIEIPLELAEVKAIMNGIGDLLLIGSGTSAVAGLAASVYDTNLERYREIRKRMKDKKLEFLGETPNSENYRASIVEVEGGAEKYFVVVRHPTPGTDLCLKENERIIETHTTGTLEELETKINKRIEKLSKKYPVISNF